MDSLVWFEELGLFVLLFGSRRYDLLGFFSLCVDLLLSNASFIDRGLGLFFVQILRNVEAVVRGLFYGTLVLLLGGRGLFGCLGLLLFFGRCRLFGGFGAAFPAFLGSVLCWGSCSWLLIFLLLLLTILLCFLLFFLWFSDFLFGFSRRLLLFLWFDFCFSLFILILWLCGIRLGVSC